MADWGFLSGLFEALQVHSPMLGRFWLLLMLVFRMLILGTVATDLFEDEQAEFACNTLQPGCKQACYDQAFPISQYRFWVFHIVLISSPALVFLMYAVHRNGKRAVAGRGRDPASRVRDPASAGRDPASRVRGDRRLRRLYAVNVAFRLLAELAFVAGQWRLYGFRVEARYPCSRFPCPYTVDCFTSRPMEKTVFLCFYFAVGVLSALASLAELLHVARKRFSSSSSSSSSLSGGQLRGQNRRDPARVRASAPLGPGASAPPRYAQVTGGGRKCGSALSSASSGGRKSSKPKSLTSSISV